MISRLLVAVLLHLVRCAVVVEESNETADSPAAPLKVDCGRVEGRIVSTPNGDVREFLQMPYGVPPLGERRWTHSQLLEPDHKTGQCWEGVYDAAKEREIKCVQYWKEKEGLRGQEDCLHLSVRTPFSAQEVADGRSTAVLVWIHGGSLMTGWCDEAGYAPTAEFTADINTVVVNINYRLDVMGFFSHPEIWADGENFGNFGFGDVITALQWVKKNIKTFGGNPDSVTLLGESSGANAVLAMLVAPKAEGLFHKAIALSSSPKWTANYREAHKARESYVSDVGCGEGDLQERRVCLKNAPIATLSKNQDVWRGYGFYDFPYGDGVGGESMDYNVIEPTIVPYSPQAIQYKDKPKMKLILSNLAQENGYNSLVYGYNQMYTWQEAHDLLIQRVQNLKDITKVRLDDNIVEEIENGYDFNKTSTDWWPQMFWDTLTTDIRATCPTTSLARQLNKNKNYDVYRMYIKHRPDEIVCGLNYDSIHGWDTEALFNFGWFQLASSNKRHQRKFQEDMRDLVEYFTHDQEIKDWTTRNTLIIENRNFPFSIEIDNKPPHSEKCKFWREEGFAKYGWQN